MWTFEPSASAQRLMDSLEEFIVRWAGPRLPDSGVSDSDLAKRSLPYPLRRLYALAGSWLAVRQDTTDRDTGLFSVGEHLREFQDLEDTEDKKLLFLDENSGNWSCSTLVSGEDPPVWIDGEFNEETSGRWEMVTASLSKLLVTFCLNELLLGSRVCRKDEQLTSCLESRKEAVRPLWLAGPYP